VADPLLHGRTEACKKKQQQQQSLLNRNYAQLYIAALASNAMGQGCQMEDFFTLPHF
jgi:hypothetical protein